MGCTSTHNFPSNKINSNQIGKCLCKIYKTDGKSGTGFFCKVPFDKKNNLYINTLITNNQNISKKDLAPNSIIKYSLNNENIINEIKINNSQITYTNENLDITIIEIISSQDEINNFLEISDNEENPLNQNIVLLQYKENSLFISHFSGFISKILDKKFEYTLISKEPAYGGVILSMNDFNIIGINTSNNIGSFIKFPINEFITLINKKYNKELKTEASDFTDNNTFLGSKCMSIMNNEIVNWSNIILITLEITKENLDYDTYFLDNAEGKDTEGVEHFHDHLLELNDSNCKLYINDKEYKYQKFFSFSKIGTYKIKLVININLTDISFMFFNCDTITEIDLSKFCTKNIFDMNSMFAGCINLKNIIFDKEICTKNVQNLSFLFYHCIKLTQINLLNFDTSNVTNMCNMFCGCEKLQEIDLSNFNTKKVTNMHQMFYSCSNLVELNLETFDTENVINMSCMFSDCSFLALLDISFFKTQNVTDMSFMFHDCMNLSYLNVSSFNTQNVNNMTGMFSGCKSLLNLNLSNFDTQKVIYMEQIFYNCNNLLNLNISNFNTINVTNMGSMFNGCSKLTAINFPKTFFTNNVVTMEQMFWGCQNLTNISLETFNTSNVINMSAMFSKCHNLKSINYITSLDTTNVKNIGGMFCGCANIVNLNLTSFKTKNVINMSALFENCINLIKLMLPNKFQTGKVKDMSFMFSCCKKLQKLDLSSFKTKNVVDMGSMFYNCEGLKEIKFSDLFNTYKVINMEKMFAGCINLTTLDLRSFDLMSVYNMNSIFHKCNKITEILIKKKYFTLFKLYTKPNVSIITL